MTSTHVIYNRFSDNLAITATLSVNVGSAADGYPIANVADVNAARPFKFNETTGAVVFDMLIAKQVKIVAIFHANFQNALPIKIQGNATNSWATPSLDVTINMPAWHADRYPGQPWVDISAVTGAGAYRYWRVAMLTANAVPLAIGDIWLGSTLRTLNLQWADTPVVGRPQIEHQTDYKKMRFPLGYTARTWTGVIPLVSDTTRDEIVNWVLDADGRPVLFIPEHSAAIPEAWLALHTTTLQALTKIASNATTLPLDMEEDGRGLEPTPSPL